MSRSATRLALASALTGALALLSVGAAASAAPSTSDPGDKSFLTPAERPERLNGRDLGAHESKMAPDEGTTADNSPAHARTAALWTEIGAPCPSAYAARRVIETQGFESGSLPYLEEGWNNGFVVESGGAAVGSWNALSTIQPGDGGDYHWVSTSAATVPSTGRVVLSFKYKAEFVADGESEVGVTMNDDYATLAPTTEWQQVYIDVTDTLAGYDGDFFSEFDNWVSELSTTASTAQVDDVQVASCTVPPVSGVRGDWTGEGTVDLLGTTTTGDLYVYPGKGNGGVSSGIRVGSGWTGFTWQGSPGDVTGDRRTDLLARRSDGTLWRYPGKGAGTFGAGAQIGSGWQGMTALATPGDVTNDGVPELLARRADGTLHLYRVNSASVTYLRQVGSGWGGMAWIIGMGDLNGDRRGDTIGVNTADGCLYAYTATTTGGLSAKGKVGCGWAGMNWLTSPGDLNKDGFGDLIARTSTGELWFYQGRPGGGVRSGVKVGSGWGSMASIL